MTGHEDRYILQMIGVSKRFPGVQALDDVSMAVKEGEIHALVGENGAGKSTLIKILSGAHPKDAGEIIYQGEPVEIRNPLHSLELGIDVIYQEFNLARHLNVPENIFMGKLPRRGLVIDWNKATADARAVMSRLGVLLPMNVPVSHLTVAEQQLVEIAKALAEKSKLLIMDEPSAVLGDRDLEKLFQVVQSLKEQGVTIIYISHRLAEVFRIADRVTVLKDGKVIGTRDVSDVKMSDLVRMMIGRELQDYPRSSGRFGEVALEIRNLSRPGVLNDVSFKARAGEITGIAGLRGAGRTELLRAIFGADPSSGEVIVHGATRKISGPRDAISHKLALVTEDRKAEGIFPRMAVRGNISLAGLADVCRLGIIRMQTELGRVLQLIKQLNIRTPSSSALAENLSGGNQQKMVVARWLNVGAEVLLLDEPTRGIDVGAKWEIYNLMVELANQGVALVMVSSELPEVIGMSDRVLVMHEGSLVADLPREGISEERIMMFATGGSES